MDEKGDPLHKADNTDEVPSYEKRKKKKKYIYIYIIVLFYTAVEKKQIEDAKREDD